MRQVRLRAVFMRGGTSKAIMLRQPDLPADRAFWPPLFRAAMGSPDLNGRQLDGMGGGISSLSKVCVIGPPSRPDADIDYTFVQIMVTDAAVDTSGNCGNMSSAVGPFAVDEGLIPLPEGKDAVVRIHNTNTGKIIHARFAMDDGQAAVDGDYAMIGVAGTGAPQRLDFIAPGGAITGKLLPTGNIVDTVEVPGLGAVEASLVDAGNAFAFVEAGVFGLTGTESPAEIDGRPGLLEAIETARNHMGVLMGLSQSPEESRATLPNQPKIAMVSRPRDAATLSGDTALAADGDLTARIVSSGNCHRALPLTGALCTSVAARIEGTVAHRLTRPPETPDADIRLMQPSGVMVLKPVVVHGADGWKAEHVGVYRTHRRLFDGTVYVPAARVPGLAAKRAELSTAAE